MKKGRFDKKNNYKVIILFVIFIGIICFSIFNLKDERNLNVFEKGIKDLTVFVSETIYAPVKFIKDKIEIYNEKEDLYKKYKTLLSKKEDIEQKEARIKELEKENKELKDTLNLNNTLSDYETINCNVISRDTGYWYNKLVIDKGTKHGIKNKMAVVIDGGLIGYVSEVSRNSSNVQLLTIENMKNRISVKIELDNGEYATGLLNKYDKEKNVYMIEGISYSGEIKKGARVTTTGLSDNFSSGLLLGHVENITTDNFELGKIVEVKPSPNFENINIVTVIKREAAIDDNN